MSPATMTGNLGKSLSDGAMSMHDCGYWSAVAVGAAITVSSTSVSFGQASNTAGGMSDITVLSVDIGHFDYGHKIIHVYENSRNQSEYRNSPERWQFVIEPLLSTRPAANGNVEFRSFALDPVIEVIGKREQIRPKHRVMGIAPASTALRDATAG